MSHYKYYKKKRSWRTEFQSKWNPGIRRVSSSIKKGTFYSMSEDEIGEWNRAELRGWAWPRKDIVGIFWCARFPDEELVTETFLKVKWQTWKKKSVATKKNEIKMWDCQACNYTSSHSARITRNGWQKLRQTSPGELVSAVLWFDWFDPFPETEIFWKKKTP